MTQSKSILVQIHDLVVSEHPNARLDAYIAARLDGVSRALVQKLIGAGHVSVNSAPQRASYKVQTGDLVRVEIPPPEPAGVAAESIPLDVVYEDASILVINKPKGMTVHPAPGSSSGTLVNAVLARCADLSGVGGVERPGIVHRLDKDTSGLIVVAKSDDAHIRLQQQIQRRTAHRHYLALVWGRTEFAEAVVDAPIGRHPTDRKKMAVIRDTDKYTARRAVTRLNAVEVFDHFTLLEAQLDTGRTHQIRVHCSFVGHPVVGDPAYGGAHKPLSQDLSKSDQRELARLVENLRGQALHAYHLAFDHPITGQSLAFEVPPPDDMQSLITWLKERRDGERTSVY